MIRSHLKTYFEIISLLAQTDTQTLTNIMFKTNLNYTAIKEPIGFLVKQGLVEEQTTENDRKLFTVTQKGLYVMKYFQRKEQTLQIAKESQNNTILF